MKYINILVIILVCILLLILISQLKDSEIYDQSGDKMLKASKQVNNGQSVEVKEEIKNGVYTNYEYGFKLEYPADKLREIDPNSDNPGGLWMYSIDDKYVYVSLILRNNNESNIYQDLYTLKEGESKSLRGVNFELVSKVIVDGHKQLSFTMRTTDSSEMEHVAGNTTTWLLDNGNVVEVNFYTDPEHFEDFLLNNISIYNNMVESFTTFKIQ